MWIEAQLSRSGKNDAAVSAAVDACVQTRRSLVAWRVLTSVNAAVTCSARSFARWAHLYERIQLGQVEKLEFESRLVKMLRGWTKTILQMPFLSWSIETVRRRRLRHARYRAASLAARLQRKSLSCWWEHFLGSTDRVQVSEGGVTNLVSANEERKEALFLPEDDESALQIVSAEWPIAMHSDGEVMANVAKWVKLGEALAIHRLRFARRGLLLWSSEGQQHRRRANVCHSFRCRRQIRQASSVIHQWHECTAERRSSNTRIMKLHSRFRVATKIKWCKRWRQILRTSSVQKHLISIVLRQSKRRLSEVLFKRWQERYFSKREKAGQVRQALILYNQTLLRDAVRRLLSVSREQRLVDRTRPVQRTP